jgi:hypothetical protein
MRALDRALAFFFVLLAVHAKQSGSIPTDGFKVHSTATRGRAKSQQGKLRLIEGVGARLVPVLVIAATNTTKKLSLAFLNSNCLHLSSELLFLTLSIDAMAMFSLLT